MHNVKLKVVRKEGTEDLALPAYTTEHAAGMDVVAAVDDSVIIQPNEIRLIPTGLFVEVPVGYEMQVRPRSGLAFKKGITVLNSPGTVDADYRGEVGVILINHGAGAFEIVRGERIAQLVVSPVASVEVLEVEKLSDTDRGAGGFGHTGV